MINELSNICKNYVNGEWIAPEQNLPVSIFNPGNLDETVGQIIYADDKLAISAIDAADKAFAYWKNIKLGNRIELLKNALNLLRKEEDFISKIITGENGKTIAESKAEINSSLIEGEHQLQFIGLNNPNNNSEEEIRYEPLGVVLLITPSNFPLSTIIRKIIPALALGNTAVLKPSEITPLTAVRFFRILQESGLPKGVANMVVGTGNIIGKTLINHSALTAISFTGSTITGKKISEMIAGRKIRLQTEMGGKNAVVVLNDADLKSALDAVVKSGFICCGQWCTGTSRVIVEQGVYDEFLKMLIERVKTIQVGIGIDERTTMGPLVSAEQFEKVKNAVNKAVEQGAILLTGGKTAVTDSLRGYYFEPTVFGNVKPDMKIAQEEIFGPVISVLSAKNLDEAISITNDSDYGLTVSIFTKNKSFGEKFINEVNAGLCHINLPTSHRNVSMPLMGWKNSGSGIPESGSYSRDFFTQTKSIYRKQL